MGYNVTPHFFTVKKWQGFKHVLRIPTHLISESCEHGVNRLVNGCDDAEGIVEICDYGVRRTVCGGDTWSNENTQVLCSELGFSREGSYI